MSVAARTWQRFTLAEKLSRFSIYLAIVFAVAWAAHSVEIIIEFIWDAPEQIADMGRRMWPVAWGYYPKGIHGALIETLNIAAVSTLLGVLMAVPVGFLAARNATPSRFLSSSIDNTRLFLPLISPLSGRHSGTCISAAYILFATPDWSHTVPGRHAGVSPCRPPLRVPHI